MDSHAAKESLHREVALKDAHRCAGNLIRVTSHWTLIDLLFVLTTVEVAARLWVMALKLLTFTPGKTETSLLVCCNSSWDESVP